MTQASISKNAYRLKVALPWAINIIFLSFLTSVITFLVFTGKSANNMQGVSKNNSSTTPQTNIFNGSDSYYRELSYQATVISLLSIITLCVVFYTFKNLL